jgi:hypothetical protein
MTQIPASTIQTFPRTAAVLEDIGEEFGCLREPGESDVEYGQRVFSYLDDMIEELQSAQDRVHELIG